MTTIFDAMPSSVLKELERMEIAISEMENCAFAIQVNSQDLHIKHTDIIA